MFCECRNIIVRYGRSVALEMESLSIEAGRITAVVGPNGAGKTTLLEVMALLRRPDSGTLRLWGSKVAALDKHLQRQIVMVMHPGYLFRGTVWSNVMYALKARGVGRRRGVMKAGEALAMVGISRLAGRDVGGLSAGERQRLNLARMIALDPRAVLLDEPDANVDSETVAAIRHLICRLRDERGTSVIYTAPADIQFHDVTDQVITLG